jgi:two-component system osmolarity sensor histidine kinase EnvZ
MNDKPQPAAKPASFSLKMFLPRTLLGRSLLILIVPVLLIQIVTTHVFFDRHWNKMTMRLAFAVAGEIAVMAEVIENNSDSALIVNLTDLAAKKLDLRIVFEPKAMLSVEDRKVHGLGWESMITRTLTQELEGQLDGRVFTVNVDFSEKWIWVDVQLKDGVLKVTLPQRRMFSSSGYIVLLWMMCTSIVLLSIAVLFMRNQIRPIRRLAVAAERFGKGRDVPSFRPQGASEVRQAAQAFIDMRDRIKRQVEQRTAMLAGVSHDLRTPLTRLKLQLAMLPNNPDVEAMKGDIQDMERMIGGYLDFVRGEGDEAVSFTDISQLIEKVVIAARRLGVNIQSDVAGEINMMLRPMAFERCILNIVNNAGKFAKNVWVSARMVEGELEIVVDDDGPGIPEDQYDEVFRPFYRVDTSRNLETGGVGLGLPIAMDVVHAHGGRIWLERAPQGGLRVIIRIPV